MATSIKHRGWKLDKDKAYLAALFNSTEVYRITASAMTVALATALGSSATPIAAIAADYKLAVYTDVQATLASGNVVPVYFEHQISTNVDMTGSVGHYGLLSFMSIEGGASTTLWSSTGICSPLVGYYYTDGVDGISVTNGVHCAVAAVFSPQANWTRSASATTSVLAVLSAASSSAAFANMYYGIAIEKISGQDMTCGMFIRDCEYFMDIEDDDVVSGMDSNSATAGNPDGFIRIKQGGGQAMYIWTYVNKA